MAGIWVGSGRLLLGARPYCSSEKQTSSSGFPTYCQRDDRRYREDRSYVRTLRASLFLVLHLRPLPAARLFFVAASRLVATFRPTRRYLLHLISQPFPASTSPPCSPSHPFSCVPVPGFLAAHNPEVWLGLLCQNSGHALIRCSLARSFASKPNPGFARNILGAHAFVRHFPGPSLAFVATYLRVRPDFRPATYPGPPLPVPKKAGTTTGDLGTASCSSPRPFVHFSLRVLVLRWIRVEGVTWVGTRVGSGKV